MEPRPFHQRHIGVDDSDIDHMLEVVGAQTLDGLIDETVPRSIRDDALDLPPAVSEIEAVRRLAELADRNVVMRSMIGMGYSGTVTPPVIKRNVLEDPSWYTAYTPYQAEISQGRLEALLNFQTMVGDLTGFEIANASLLDEGTAAAEAMAMAHRADKSDRNVFWVDSGCHPQTIEVVRTRANPVGIEVRVEDPDRFDLEAGFGVLLQYPSTTGQIRDFRSLAARARDAGVMVVAAADILALTLLTPPGEWGAHIAVGSTQRFGVPMGFGGPHAAYIATSEDLVRSLPGRLVGVSTDPAGRTAHRLALQTREQHIRRERATSNVCTAQVLLAVIAGFYAAWHGPDGLVAIARHVQAQTSALAAGLAAAGWELASDTWFDTLTVVSGDRTDEVLEAARERGINLRRVDDRRIGISCDETTTDTDVDDVLAAFSATRSGDGASGLPDDLLRTSEFLTHPVFHRHRSETEMLRYLRRLSDKDLALDRTMIPLGSCTMKLNATSEMIPITWQGFADIHPFAPADQVRGYHRLIEDLEAWLAEITGYDAVSLQPNAGSQGEFAGLLAIRAYHDANTEHARDVCLIPSSAHGTNAASAVMAGFRVVVVACDDEGNVDVEDLRARLAEHGDAIGALMVTYPSTQGVFEEAIREICDLVHEAGGQVYVDGANLNALVGIAKPGGFGADVSHLNLHKTFTIPHGGGGPGVGPIGVRAHLAPYLPGHPVSGGPSVVGPVSSARWGSAGILPIPWAYIAMMGPRGLRRASQVAILSANYVAKRLADAYPILYVGKNGRVAHECIVDLRPITRASGITAEDVAKRLADYEFHAPTLSFPVAGTLMIEPTESESLRELDRFCDAMLAIREEIRRVESGEWPRDDNPLVRAPHPAADLIGDWQRAYPAEIGAFPVTSLRTKGYFPPVGRVDGPSGDRNLVCACPPVAEYA
ncbi:MAG: aminomethyl-transferring glycine dehydrogenase [Acidimicrobiia bacterium]|nr:aminomethyl-transferring glycine dehydrogenase [Acidimicrobiia bacterium]